MSAPRKWTPEEIERQKPNPELIAKLRRERAEEYQLTLDDVPPDDDEDDGEGESEDE